MPDILTHSPETGKTLQTGLDTEAVSFDTRQASRFRSNAHDAQQRDFAVRRSIPCAPQYDLNFGMRTSPSHFDEARSERLDLPVTKNEMGTETHANGAHHYFLVVCN